MSSLFGLLARTVPSIMIGPYLGLGWLAAILKSAKVTHPRSRRGLCSCMDCGFVVVPVVQFLADGVLRIWAFSLWLAYGDVANLDLRVPSAAGQRFIDIELSYRAISSTEEPFEGTLRLGPVPRNRRSRGRMRPGHFLII